MRQRPNRNGHRLLMNNLSRIVLALLFLTTVIMFSGCTSIPSHENTFYSYSHKFQTCRKFDFIISGEKVGRIGDSLKVPLKECDNITGLKNYDKINGWPTFRVWLESLFYSQSLSEDGGVLLNEGFDIFFNSITQE